MNIDFSNKITSLSLLLLWLAYAFLGWHLSFYDIFWLVGIFIATLALFVGRKNNSLFEHLLRFFTPGFFGIFIISLIVIILVFTLAINSPILATLTIIPIATTVLAELEMRLTGLSKLNALLILTVIAGFGLVIGKMIDIVILPSSMY